MYPDEQAAGLAHELGSAIGLIKFAHDHFANDPAKRDKLISMMSPAHTELVRSYQEAAAPRS